MLIRFERRWRKHFNVEPVDAETTRKAVIYMRWFDHEVVRTIWTNQAEIAPGVLRSNQPTVERLERLAQSGITNVLSLRGVGQGAPYFTEKMACDRLGMSFDAIALNARRAPTQDELLSLIEIFRRIERPFLMHCKSGADRAGLASAIYLMVIEGQPVQQARRMLCMSYFHFKWSATGVLDRVLDAFETTGEGLAFERWVATRYDPAAIV
jgi:protein tyrosine phosphatase (PTP) superfamily phosphohydrolase (DUF442 family)